MAVPRTLTRALVALALTAVLVLPLLAPVLVGATWFSARSGRRTAWWVPGVGRSVAASIGYPRFPEILAAVSKPM